MKRLVVGLGETLWDCLPSGRRVGGAPANFAYHASQLGLDGCIVSAVGADEDGRALRAALEAKGMRACLAEADRPTGRVDVTLDASGVASYTIAEDVAWDAMPFTPAMASLAERASAVCFGTLAQRSEATRRTMRRFVEAAANREEQLRVLDINLREPYYSQQVVEESLALCNALKLNDEELYIVGQMLGWPLDGLLTECPRVVERYGLRWLAVTCGAAGSYVFTPETSSYLESPRVAVADTVGAGDSFTAALVAALLSGRPLDEAHHLAVETSAYVCTQEGAMPPLPPQLRQALGSEA